INNSKSAIKKIRKILPKQIIPHYEVVGVLFLDTSLNYLGHNIIHKGGINQSIVDVRLIMQNALVCNATSIIMFHNHPGGSLFPSQGDIDTTDKLKKAGEVIG